MTLLKAINNAMGIVMETDDKAGAAAPARRVFGRAAGRPGGLTPGAQ
jgi:hypothetical protein